MRPIEALDEKRVAQLIADLNADAFTKRETASAELVRLEERVEDALRRALQHDASPEAKRRIGALLEVIDCHTLSPETLGAVRAVEALERIGTPEARKLLETLATGAPAARLTRDAKASLKRLEK